MSHISEIDFRRARQRREVASWAASGWQPLQKIINQTRNQKFFFRNEIPKQKENF